MRKITRAGLVFVTASCVLGAPLVAAVPYGASAASVESSGAVPESGGPVTLTAKGMCAGDLVTFSIGGVPVGNGPVQVGADGTASITLSNYVPGADRTVVAASNGTGICKASPSTTLALAASFGPTPTVGSSASGAGSGVGAGSDLPTTGSDSVSTLQVAGAATVAGVGLIGVSVFRRRQRRSALTPA